MDNHLVGVYSQYLYNRARRGFQYSLQWPTTVVDAFDLFSAEDLEDIVAVWLQMRGYLLVGSSRRSDTAFYEYVLKHRETGRDAVAQVKGGNETLNRDEYSGLEGEVFLFAAGGIYAGQSHRHVHCIDRAELFRFVSENPSVQSSRVNNWMNLWNDLRGRASQAISA